MSSSQQDAYWFERVDDGVMTRTIDGLINFWNHGAEKLYGWTREEAIGKISHDLLQTQFPQPLEEIESELVQKGRWEGKLVHTTRDGGRVAVQSRWTFEPRGQLGAVVEINTRSTDYEMDVEARTGTRAVQAGKQERLRASKSIKVEEFLAKIGNIILCAGGILCLVSVAYFVFYYLWTGQRVFTSPVGPFVYFVLPGSLAIALFMCLRLPAPQRTNVALCCASVALTIFTIEATMALWFSLPSVRVSQHRRTLIEAATSLGMKYDRRTKAEVIDDFRQRGIDAIPSLNPYDLLKRQDGMVESPITINGVEVLPLASIADKLTVVCNEGGDFLTYTSDKHGFNNPPYVWDAPVDIVAVGDSYTQGWCVGPEDSFVSVIRKHHPKTLNLGIEGNGALVMLATIKEYAESVKPKVVLWFYYEGNDLEDLRDERRNFILNRYLTNNEFSQGLLNRQTEIDRALEAYLETMPKTDWSIKLKEISELAKRPNTLPWLLQDMLTLSALRQRLGLIFGTDVKSPSGEGGAVLQTKDTPQIDLLFDILLQAKKSVGEWGGTLYFVYLPSPTRYLPGKDRDDNRRAVLSAVSKADLPVIDMYPIFMAQKDPLSLFPFRLADHYNEKGHWLVAQEVLQAIFAEGLSRQGENARGKSQGRSAKRMTEGVVYRRTRRSGCGCAGGCRESA